MTRIGRLMMFEICNMQRVKGSFSIATELVTSWNINSKKHFIIKGVAFFLFLNDNYPNHYSFSWYNFLSEIWPLSTNYNSFRYYNLNAYEHLNVRTLGYKKFAKKKVFDVSRLKLISFCLPGKYRIPLKKVLIPLWQKHSQKRKKKDESREVFCPQKFLPKHMYVNVNVTVLIGFQCFLMLLG